MSIFLFYSYQCIGSHLSRSDTLALTTLVALDEMACNVVLTRKNSLRKQVSKMHTYLSMK